MNTEEKIIQAATDLFKQQGYTKATTASVAKEAGVSEVTVFRYFKTKENLFKQVVKNITSKAGLSSITEGFFTGDTEKDLLFIADHALRYFIKEGKTIRMMMFETINHPEIVPMISETPMRNIKNLSEYFKRQTRAGKINCDDFDKCAELFLGALNGYGVGITTIKNTVPDDNEISEMAEFIVSSFLKILK